MIGRSGAVAAALAVAVAVGCRPARPRLSDEDAGQLIASRVSALQAGAAVPDPAASLPALPAPTATPRPPRSDAERRSRAEGAIPAGESLGALTPVADGARFALALSDAPGGSEPRQLLLQLFDVSSPTGLLVGEHQFGTSDGSSAGPPSASIRSGVELRAEGSEPVILAVFDTDGRAGQAPVPCGWWLRRRGTTFVCAPMLSPASRFSALDGALLESWAAEVPGPSAAGEVMSTGRLLRLADGRWREVDQFRCLSSRPADALREAGGNGIGWWQREMVHRLTAAARRANDALDADAARDDLREALRVDGCDAEVYRLIGRLDFDTGRAGEAVPALARAAALAPREEGTLLDLADALAVLNQRTPAGREAFHRAVAALEDRPPTRQIVDRARARSRGALAPRDLAIALYGSFLERTAGTADLSEAARRHAQEKIAELERPAAPARRRR